MSISELSESKKEGHLEHAQARHDIPLAREDLQNMTKVYLPNGKPGVRISELLPVVLGQNSPLRSVYCSII